MSSEPSHNNDNVDGDVGNVDATHQGQNLSVTQEMGSYAILPADSAETPFLFHEDLHVSYIVQMASKLEQSTSFEGALTEHLKISGVYWSLTAISLLRTPQQLDALLQASTRIVDWVFTCYDDRSGGFGGNTGHDGHLLYTLSALQILALTDRLGDRRLQRSAIRRFIIGLQQPDGSFTGDGWGEVDTRFSYCALYCLALLQSAEESGSSGTVPDTDHNDMIDIDRAVHYIAQCRNLDGGFGAVVGAESHAGQVFCCVAALAIAQQLDRVLPKPQQLLLGWWLAERQVDSGGLNGRPEKQADVCYSWWILSALTITGQLSWIHQSRLATFILKCQDDVDGGIADRPDDMPDVFHTFFGIAALSLLGFLPPSTSSFTSQHTGTTHRRIDPVYALPVDVVQRLGLQSQMLPPCHPDGR